MIAQGHGERHFPILFLNQPENNITINSDDLSTNILGDIISSQNINTSGAVITPNNIPICLRAGKSIKLTNGFNHIAGKTFSAYIDNITDCGEEDDILKDVLVVEGPGQVTVRDASDYNKITSLRSPRLYPNPINLQERESINFSFSIEQEEPFKF